MSIVHVDGQQRFDPTRMVKLPLVESPFFFCDVYCLEPGQEQRIHEHADSDKVYYVLDGVATITLGDTAHRAEPGMLAHAPAGVAHGVRNDDESRLRLLVFLSPRPRH